MGAENHVKMNYPTGMALTSSGILLVCDCNNNRLLIARLNADETKLKCIGTFKENDWSCPWDVDVNDVGQVVVTMYPKGGLKLLEMKESKVGTPDHSVKLSVVQTVTKRSSAAYNFIEGIAMGISNTVLVLDENFVVVYELKNEKLE